MKNLLLALTLLATPLALSAQTDFDLEEIADGLDLPVDIESDPNNTLHILEKGGDIKILENGQVLTQPFLSLNVATDSEQGLLGMAFDPDYANNGHFFVYYSLENPSQSILSRYTVSADPKIADPNSALIILTLPQPQNNHNGGDLNFGPDGYLYIGLGDGGRSVDAQDQSNWLGSILRIDVSNATQSEPYLIPSDNPFVGDSSTFDEVWSKGWRNPWRFSFDKMNGDMWVGDVGQNTWEEVSYEPASAGGGLNYGWRCFEGLASFNMTNCGPSTDYVAPVVQYSLNTADCSVIGGFVYRGSEYANLYGKYIHTDFCSGEFRALTPDGSGGFDGEDLDDVGWRPSSFGQNSDGDLFVADYGGGRIFKVVGEASSVASENEIPEALEFSVYPNPAVDEIFLTSSTSQIIGSKFSIYDVSGSLLLEGRVDEPGRFGIDVKGLVAGAYFLQIEKEGLRRTSLFVKG